MLQEGRAEAESGRDVVIGYLEPHGREETVAQAEGLEIVPRRERRLPRHAAARRWTCRRCSRASPELCLIDELAHTNAPGVEHEKRYEDVRDVLDAGIDVFSTVNVQHLESLNDQVAQLTGTRVRETIPDEVLSAADEVVLIDLTPEALIARLRAGKVYRARARAGGAEQLLQDREPRGAARDGAAPGRRGRRGQAARARAGPAVRRDEEGVGRRRRPRRRRSPSACWRSRRSRRDSEHVVRRAWRSAQRLDAELDVLVVRPPGRAPSAEDRERLEALRRLTSMLGARLRVEEGEDVAAVAIDVGARARQPPMC